MQSTCEWREHDGVPYVFLCPGGPGSEHLAELLRFGHEAMVPSPPGLLRVLVDRRPTRGAGVRPADLAAAKQLQRELLVAHTLRMAVLGLTGIHAAAARGLSAMSAKVTIVPAPSLESALGFLVRDAR